MIYLIRFSGEEVSGFWAANSNERDSTIREAKNLSKVLKCNVFLDEKEGLKEVYAFTPYKKS